MRAIISLVCFCLTLQSEVPYKPNDEFKFELDYQFRQRQAPENNKISIGELTPEDQQKRKYGIGPLPYLVISFYALKLQPEEIRIRAVSGDGVTMVSKKAEIGKPYILDMGYTDDMKDRVTPHEFNVYFLTNKRKEISRVNLFIKEDGIFLVNGEVRGRF
jgi:hypothetical protein